MRNYMARNYLRQMSEGDLVLYYHSNAEPSGVVGLARVAFCHVGTSVEPSPFAGRPPGSFGELTTSP